jgi:hypothetical protein
MGHGGELILIPRIKSVKNYRLHFWLLVVTSIFLSLLTSVRADIRLPAIFGDHMVLQQKSKLPVWGRAATVTPYFFAQC